MKKTTKKLFAGLTAAGMLLSGAAFAEEANVTSADEPVVIAPAPESTAPNGASVNGIEVVELDIAMIPLRQVCEGLGYSVNWNDENQSIDLIRGAQFITMQIGQDSYAFSRMAPQSLGTAPVLLNDSTTYVPLTFVSQILGGIWYQNEDNTLEIVLPAVVTVLEVTDETTLLVSDSALGEVVVHIGEDTVLTDGTRTVNADIIEKDMVLSVVYGNAMTASLPPQTTARRIQIENLPVEASQESTAAKVTVLEVTDETTLLVSDSTLGEVVVYIGDETVITDGEKAVSADSIKKDMTLSVVYGDAMTASLPPQTTARTIRLMDSSAAQEPESVAFSGVITEIDGELVTLGNPAEDADSIRLVISENTVFTGPDAEASYSLDNLEVGTEIKGTHSMAATFSIPPQSVAYTVEILRSK